MKKNLYFYGTLDREQYDSSKYVHPYLTIIESCQVGNDPQGRIENSNYTPKLQFRWQGDDHNPGWYAFKIKMVNVDRLTDIRLISRLANRVLGKLEPHQNDPTDILAALKRCRAKEIRMDYRVNGYLLLDDIHPPEVERWMDDYNKFSWANCQVSALAETPEEAQPLLAQEFTRLATEGTYSRSTYLKRFTEWAEKGMPVKLDSLSYRDKPDNLPFGDRLKAFSF